MMPEITVAGLKLAHPVMNAAGTCKKLIDVRRFAASEVSASVVGTYTCKRRPEARNAYYIDPSGRFSANAMRLPNAGKDYLERNAEAMWLWCCFEAQKPLILNIAGDSPEEFAALAKLAVKYQFSAIEVNLSCPTRGRPIFYQREPTALVVNAVNDVAFGKIPVLYKLGPIGDPVLLRSQVQLIASKGADGLVAINTFGGGMVYQPIARRPVIRRPMGIGGTALLPIGVGMVAQIREFAPNRVDIIGVGGISSGMDIRQYLAAGAVAVQAGTLCWAANRDPQVYGDLLADYRRQS